MAPLGLRAPSPRKEHDHGSLLGSFLKHQLLRMSSVLSMSKRHVVDESTGEAEGVHSAGGHGSAGYATSEEAMLEDPKAQRRHLKQVRKAARRAAKVAKREARKAAKRAARASARAPPMDDDGVGRSGEAMSIVVGSDCVSNENGANALEAEDERGETVEVKESRRKKKKQAKELKEQKKKKKKEKKGKKNRKGEAR